MEDCKGCKRRVENNNRFKQVDENPYRWKILNKAEYSVKSKDEGHKRSYIFPDLLDLLILSVDVPYPYIIEGPENRQEKGNNHRDPTDDQEPPRP